MTDVIKPVSEAEFQRQVVRLASLCGWLVHHARPARTARDWRTPVQGASGFPDLVLARRGTVLIVELKTDHGRVSADQQDWLDALGTARVWRPGDWPQIEETLKEL